MANTLGTLNGKIVAQRVLDFLKVQFPLLTRISSNFSGEGLLFNQDLVTRVPSVPSVADYHATNGYVASDSTTTDITVRIDQHKHVSLSFNDQEVSQTNRNLIDEQAAPAAYALGKGLFDYVAAKVTGANFPYEHVKTVANWGRRTLVDINGIMNKRGVPNFGRFAVVNSAVYAELCDDVTIVANAGMASNTASTGLLPNVHGIDVIEDPSMITAVTPQFLNGYVGTVSGLAIATCIPKDPASVMGGLPIPGKIYSVSDAATGITLMVREFYDIKLGRYQYTITWMYGAAVGLAGTLERVVTQATTIGSTVVDTLT